MKRLALILFLALAAAAGFAKEAAPLAEDPVVEQRLIEISQDLRCLVCQNESLAASQADLAKDLRREVRELIRAGRSDDDIRAYLVARYGDFVLYKPPVKPTTWLLWGGPFALLFAALAGFIWYLRRVMGRAAQDSGIAGDAGEPQA
jgi:cytochrome c-type biogenesis protein CcmH